MVNVETEPNGPVAIATAPPSRSDGARLCLPRIRTRLRIADPIVPILHLGRCDASRTIGGICVFSSAALFCDVALGIPTAHALTALPVVAAAAGAVDAMGAVLLAVLVRRHAFVRSPPPVPLPASHDRSDAPRWETSSVARATPRAIAARLH